MTAGAKSVTAARPQLIRAMNEQALLAHIRRSGPHSRAELARMSGLSKPTVSLALANLERAGLVHATGQRTGVPGPAAVLYEIRPDAGFVLALDVGRQYLRGAVADLAGRTRARLNVRTKAGTAAARVRELAELGAALRREAGVARRRVTQTVLGSPGVYDPKQDSLTLTGRLSGWDSPDVLTALRNEFGADLTIENDVDAAALAERAHGHGRDVESFAFVSVGTGIGMGLVVDGELHRGSHGVAGEISYLPFAEGHGVDAKDARRRGSFDAAASGAAVVRAARRAGLRVSSAKRVFAAAAAGNPIAARIVDEEALLVAKAVCAVITVADPELIVLGGGIGQAAGFIDAVARHLDVMAPVRPEVKASVLGAESVVAGCVAAGLDRAWESLTSAIPAPG